MIRRKLLARFVFLMLLATALIRTTPAAAATKSTYLVYIGTYTDHDSKGIYAYRFDSRTGHLASLGLAVESENPSFLAVSSSGQFLYAVNELDSYQGQPTGAASAFAIDSATGKLSLLNQVSSHDPGPAHITLDRTGKFAFLSNYNLGSVAVFPILQDGRLGELSSFVRHRGSGTDKRSQEGPHAHAVALSADDRFAVVADLGIDQVLVYPFNAATGKLGAAAYIAHAHPGSGPRHLAFDPRGRFLYLINEMSSSVTTYSYDQARGELREAQTISALPQGFADASNAAEIVVHPSGKFLYASNRGHDSIAVFKVDPAKGTLSPVECVRTNGKTPRNFALDPTGSWLLAANQDSGTVVVFRINLKSGRLTPTGQSIQVPSPACVTFVPLP